MTSIPHTPMTDLPDMTVNEHHLRCLGVLAECYPHVPGALKQSILEAACSARKMGCPIIPENLIYLFGPPLPPGQLSTPQKN